MQLWATQIVGLSTAQLRMDYGPEFLHILGLVQRDLHRDPILVMTDPAVGKLVPLDLKLPKGCMQVTNHSLLLLWFTCELNVVHMLGEHGCKSGQLLGYLAMFDAHFRVYQTGLHATLVIGDCLELDRESSRGVR